MEDIIITFVILFSAFVIVGIVCYIASGMDDAYVDDGEPIKNEHLMIIHCDVVHTGAGLYQMLDCAICPYREEECKKYMHRHNGKTPVEVLRKNREE